MIGKYILKQKGSRRSVLPVIAGTVAGCLILFLCFIGHVKIDVREFTESSRELYNPNRGFYRIYGFEISDEITDYQQVIAGYYQDDTHTSLSLIEVNLQNYREGAISEAGLANIDALFRELEAVDKNLIVRFLYDWVGEIDQYEPESIEIILNHMKQLEPIFCNYSKQIFVVQGLFTGNWGEMNGTRYSRIEHLRQLAAQLFEVTDSSTFLAVRMPSQWRRITQIKEWDAEEFSSNPLAVRLSLFNDSMLSDESDGGTYGMADFGGEGMLGREEELDFQRQLCARVPNGGEVIRDNPYNDFYNSIKDLATMHVSYLNDGYDKAVLEKWAKENVQEESCFNGMDGYTYIERHLGYRLLIDEVEIEEKGFRKSLSVNIAMKNVGFAPLYREPEVVLVLREEKENRITSYALSGDLRELTGGDDSEALMALTAEIPIKGLSKDRYFLYFYIVDPDSGKHILLANAQDEEAYGEVYDIQYGYRIGTVDLR